jgi:hypothetical protein
MEQAFSSALELVERFMQSMTSSNEEASSSSLSMASATRVHGRQSPMAIDVDKH